MSPIQHTRGCTCHQAKGNDVCPTCYTDLRARLEAAEQDAAAYRKLFDENPNALWARVQSAEQRAREAEAERDEAATLCGEHAERAARAEQLRAKAEQERVWVAAMAGRRLSALTVAELARDSAIARAEKAEAERDEARRRADMASVAAAEMIGKDPRMLASRIRADRDAAIARATAAEGREAALRTALARLADAVERESGEYGWSDENDPAAYEEARRVLAAQAPTDATATISPSTVAGLVASATPGIYTDRARKWLRDIGHPDPWAPTVATAQREGGGE